MNQNKTPIFTAMKEYHKKNVVPFDVPGHKHGNGLSEYKEYFGANMMELDVNSMKPLDFLGNPTSVIKESEKLLADAFKGSHGFFIVHGTSFAVQAMILATVKLGDKIMLPRNVHKSAINALILSGARPVYINPYVNEELGIAQNVKLEDIKKIYEDNKDIKGIFLTNPTYYGATTDLKSIVEFAHERGIKVLVDEAHGSHFCFSESFPISAMEAGADMSAISLHKTGGSLTQSSALLVGSTGICPKYIRKIINLMHTTSPSYLLLGSLDVARKQLAINGNEIFKKLIEISNYAREKLNSIDGCYSMGREVINSEGVYDFDITKLSISLRDLGISGMELYDILRDEYNIQMETGDIYQSLAILSLGDSYESVDKLINAIKDISNGREKKRLNYKNIDLLYPKVILTPREAFYSDKKLVPFEEALGKVSGESIMSYPPGIPIISYGEEINEFILEELKLLKKSGGVITGNEDPDMKFIKVLDI